MSDEQLPAISIDEAHAVEQIELLELARPAPYWDSCSESLSSVAVEPASRRQRAAVLRSQAYR